ncbi:MAG: hypothetical protein H6737_28515 [Alphaproteobacteria bacterium]|nr:hypothetical protein [Alphaproteobacteria bacterium]
MPFDPSDFDIDAVRLDRPSRSRMEEDAPEDLHERVSTVRRALDDKLRGVPEHSIDTTTADIQRELDLIQADLDELDREGRPGHPSQSDAFRMRLSDLEQRVAGLRVPL